MSTPQACRLLDKSNVAGILGVTIRTIDRMIASRTIPFLRFPTANGMNSKVRFDSLEIDSWLKSLREPTAATSGERMGSTRAKVGSLQERAGRPRERALELIME